MSHLTFKDYLTIVNEDTSADVVKLQADIGAIDAQINQRTQPLVQRKTQLQKLLMIKQQQQQAEAAKAGQDPNAAQNPNSTQPPATANKTTTPGGTGTGTPGNQPSSAVSM